MFNIGAHMKVAIIGAGLTGLATAYYLGKKHSDWQIDIYESANRVGGKIQTKRVDGYVVEVGPDSYLARKTAMTDLVKEVGLGHTLVRNATGESFIYDRGSMKPIPGGSIVGIPTEFLPFAMSSLLSWEGKFRALQDYLKRPYPTEGDVSMGEFFRYHLGQELVDKLIDPLLGGIYGGDIYKLSLDATFPEFHRLERTYGNMVKGMLHMKKQRSEQGKPEGQFMQLTGGLASLIDALVDRMPSNVTIHLETSVFGLYKKEELGDIDVEGFSHKESIETVREELSQIDIDAYALGLDMTRVDVDMEESSRLDWSHRVIMTTPPKPYSMWFDGHDVMRYIWEMNQSSCAIAIMSFEKADFNVPLRGTGFVITRQTETPLTACTYISEKWPQTTPNDKVVLRVFMGKSSDETVHNSTEEELKNIAFKEIRKILGFTANPLWTEIVRLDRSMPQYEVGHRQRVAEVKAYLGENFPGVYAIGTPFDGVGMPDGVKQAKELVDSL